MLPLLLLVALGLTPVRSRCRCRAGQNTACQHTTPPAWDDRTVRDLDCSHAAWMRARPQEARMVACPGRCSWCSPPHGASTPHPHTLLLLLHPNSSAVCWTSPTAPVTSANRSVMGVRSTCCTSSNPPRSSKTTAGPAMQGSTHMHTHARMITTMTITMTMT